MLPTDPVMLLSVVNTKLRDVYANLDMLCDDLDVEQHELVTKLNAISYVYDVTQNQFI